MNRRLPCPHLPIPERDLDWRHLRQSGTTRDSIFYLRCLEYANHLWMTASPARSLLAVDRALLTRLRGEEPELKQWPIPYAAVAWIVRHADPDLFLGNPRIHYQHLADRVRGPDQELKRWRAWACWHLVRATRPELKGDPRHTVTIPGATEVGAGLEAVGIAGEREIWEAAFP